MTPRGGDDGGVLVFGVSSDEVARRLCGVVRGGCELVIEPLDEQGVLRVGVSGGEAGTHQSVLAEIEVALGAYAIGAGAESLAASVVTLATERGRTLSTAESCTGGLIGSWLTGVPGASAVYVGGWVSYSDRFKIDQLGVSAGLIEEQGAVSGPVVEAMVRGAVGRSGVDLGVAVSGVAGPGGGTADKPVGTVWLGVGSQSRDGGGGVAIQTICRVFPGDRDAVRRQAAACALQALRFVMLGEPVESLCTELVPKN